MLNPSNLLNEEGIEFTSRICTGDPFNPAEGAEIKIVGGHCSPCAKMPRAGCKREKSLMRQGGALFL
jgi:hypothetical protein